MPARVMMVREDASGGPAGEVEIQAIETRTTFDSLDDIPSSYYAPGDGVQLQDGTTPIVVNASSLDAPGWAPSGDEIFDGQITWLNNKSTFAAVSYTVAYTSGAYAYPQLGWKYAVRGYRFVTENDGNINTLGVAPGVAEPVPVWTTLAAAQSASAGQFAVIALTQPGPLGFWAPAGSAQAAGVDQPTGLSLTQAGTAGTTTYSYRVTALNGSGETVSNQVATSAGNAALTLTNYNVLSWTAVAGASSYNVYGNSLGGETLMKNIWAGTTTYNDTGSDIPDGVTYAPVVDTTAVTGVTFTVTS
jgi:hypothetical protein